MAKDTYSINPADRIKELDPFLELTPDVKVSYTWNHGYETLIVDYSPTGGRSEFRGAYHPDIVCETSNGESEGICVWCGRTLM